MFIINNTLDLLYFVLSIAAIWIGVMLAWLLFEGALMLHRTNTMVRGALDKIRKLERAFLGMRDRMESSSAYLSALAEGGKVLMNYIGDKKMKKSKRRRRDEDEEDEE